MMILVGFISKKRGYGNLTTEKLTWPRFWKAFKPEILPLLLPIIIIGGIRIGIFTATEAGAVAILYAALLGIIYREMHVKDMVQGLKETVYSQRPSCSSYLRHLYSPGSLPRSVSRRR